MEKRLDLLRQKLEDKKLDALLISKPENCFYFSGYTDYRCYETFLLITKNKALVLTDFRNLEEAKSQISQALDGLYDITSGFERNWSELVRKLKIKTLGFEDYHLSFYFYNLLKKSSKGCRLIGIKDLIYNLRAIKDSQELRKIEKGAQLLDKAFKYIKKILRPNIKENEIAFEIEKFLRTHGAEKISFDPIVASGKNSAKPHYQTSRKKIEKGEMIIIDYGAKVEEYCSDFSRTVFIGTPTSGQAKIYHLVLQAQKNALKNIESGMESSKADGLGRKIIKKAGFGQSFGHNLGHGLGLESHEFPYLGPKNKEKLAQNMVCTIEPGIYLEGWGGVRIEDMVIIKKDHSKVLTKSPKSLKEMIIK